MAPAQAVTAPISLPGWPRYLSRRLAAQWAGVSITTWDQEVAAGKWPKGLPRGKKGGKLTWDLVQLEARANRRIGVGGPIDDYDMVRAEAAARRQRHPKA